MLLLQFETGKITLYDVMSELIDVYITHKLSMSVNHT